MSYGLESQLFLEGNYSRWYDILVSLYLPQDDHELEASKVLLDHFLYYTDCSRYGHMTTSELIRAFGDKLIGYYKERASIFLMLRTLKQYKPVEMGLIFTVS